MAVLERRVQILFDPVEFDRLERLAAQLGSSVGAVVRQSVADRLAREQRSKTAALARVLTQAADVDPLLADWDAVKDSFEGDRFEGIS
ncbi:MAG: hypothetical protein LBR20_00455 [Propionibacteriaceae bacterium]|jgi:predicted transcriptional regulator|nr:hypothetical protein [Propionibacteriaceae bacterium]